MDDDDLDLLSVLLAGGTEPRRWREAGLWWCSRPYRGVRAVALWAKSQPWEAWTALGAIAQLDVMVPPRQAVPEALARRARPVLGEALEIGQVVTEGRRLIAVWERQRQRRASAEAEADDASEFGEWLARTYPPAPPRAPTPLELLCGGADWD